MDNFTHKVGLKMVNCIEKKICLLKFSITQMDNFTHKVGTKMDGLKKKVCINVDLLLILRNGQLYSQSWYKNGWIEKESLHKCRFAFDIAK